MSHDAASARGQPPPALAAAPPGEHDGLAACVQLIRGPTDEHRIVGLLMLTKHISVLPKEHDDVSAPPAGGAGAPAEQVRSSSQTGAGPGSESGASAGSTAPALETVRAAIVSALEPMFVKRLLITDQSLNIKGSAPPSTDALALSMLSFLCTDRQVAAKYADIIPTVVAKLTTYTALALSSDIRDAKDAPSDAGAKVESIIVDGLRFLCMFASRSDVLQAVTAGIVPLCVRASILFCLSARYGT